MDNKELIEYAVTELKSLQEYTKETAALAILNKSSMSGTVLKVLPGSETFNFVPSPGYNFPLHSSAPGKVFLAFMSKEDREHFYSMHTLFRQSKNTITDKKTLENELAQIRSNFVALDNEEAVEGISCISGAVFDQNDEIVAAIWITGPLFRVKKLQENSLEEKIRATASRISSSIRQNSIPNYINSIVDATKNYMYENYNTDINLNKLAAEFNVGYSYFRRNFKKIVGVSPYQYQLAIRIAKAKDLLFETSKLVKDIAFELGYHSQENFSKSFKKQTGMSPLHFRNNSNKLKK